MLKDEGTMTDDELESRLKKVFEDQEKGTVPPLSTPEEWGTLLCNLILAARRWVISRHNKPTARWPDFSPRSRGRLSVVRHNDRESGLYDADGRKVAGTVAPEGDDPEHTADNEWQEGNASHLAECWNSFEGGSADGPYADELDEAAAILQRVHPAGQVKAIGRREVAAALCDLYPADGDAAVTGEWVASEFGWPELATTFVHRSWGITLQMSGGPDSCDLVWYDEADSLSIASSDGGSSPIYMLVKDRYQFRALVNSVKAVFDERPPTVPPRSSDD